MSQPEKKYVHVSVDISKLKKHKLPKLPEQDPRCTPQAAAVEALKKRSDEDLVLDNILIGAKAREFKTWFNAHAEFIMTLRERLPARGRNHIEIISDGTTTLYTWSEFCLQFFGVSAHWIAKLVVTYQGMHDEPNLGDQAKKPTKRQKVSDEARAEQENIEQVKNTALRAENLAMQYRLELRNLMGVVTQFGNTLPQHVQDYLKELDNRLKAIESAFTTSVPAKRLNLPEDDEPQIVTVQSVDDLLNELEPTGNGEQKERSALIGALLQEKL